MADLATYLAAKSVVAARFAVMEEEKRRDRSAPPEMYAALDAAVSAFHALDASSYSEEVIARFEAAQ